MERKKEDRPDGREGQRGARELVNMLAEFIYFTVVRKKRRHRRSGKYLSAASDGFIRDADLAPTLWTRRMDSRD